MSMLIFDHERGQYWKNNKFGYTDDVNQAGEYNYDEAKKIMEDANLFNINTTIFVKNNLKAVLEYQKLLNKNSERERAPLSDILNMLSTKSDYDKTNPYGKIVDTLESEGYYVVDYNEDPSLYNDESKSFILEFKNYKKENAKITISRLSSGNYETVAYAVNPNIRQSNKYKNAELSVKKNKP